MQEGVWISRHVRHANFDFEQLKADLHESPPPIGTEFLKNWEAYPSDTIALPKSTFAYRTKRFRGGILIVDDALQVRWLDTAD